MSVRNGTPTSGPSTDLLGSLGLPYPDDDRRDEMDKRWQGLTAAEATALLTADGDEYPAGQRWQSRHPLHIHRGGTQ